MGQWKWTPRRTTRCNGRKPYRKQVRGCLFDTPAGVSTNLSAGQAFNQILSEIRTMNEVYQSMFHTLTEEIINLRNEVSQLRALPTTESVSNLLPTLPLPTLVKFQEFDQKLLAENDLRVNLKNFLLRVGGSDLSAFTRLALRRILSDEASTNITWCGTNDKPSFQSFATFNVIKEIGFLRFSYATDVDIHKICQQHFLHAKDRINKKLKTKTKKLNVNDTI
ncbi:uncharacterized protein LOC115763308 isoform X2 [Drosophila novamexicana]|uniref:uncharacterized protein LOC115763308 isoform X2 n=1 Tax=Drosophila novamexicana TaxID=47314 RepID=UPI0011E5BC77|nr:uncharacterized protein LOC115763308 isoform X2 [Drosophila novamexicana]